MIEPIKKPKSKIISLSEAKKMENTELSVEQAGNYINHKDFHEASMQKVKDLTEKPKDPRATNPNTQLRLLRTALACLPKKDKGLVYRQLLACRIKGATYEQMSISMKMSVVKVKQIEKEAMDTVKKILMTRKIAPVVQ